MKECSYKLNIGIGMRSLFNFTVRPVAPGNRRTGVWVGPWAFIVTEVKGISLPVPGIALSFKARYWKLLRRYFFLCL
jgi:hypothetical protein